MPLNSPYCYTVAVYLLQQMINNKMGSLYTICIHTHSYRNDTALWVLMVNQGQSASFFSISVATPTDNTESWKRTEKAVKIWKLTRRQKTEY